MLTIFFDLEVRTDFISHAWSDTTVAYGTPCTRVSYGTAWGSTTWASGNGWTLVRAHRSTKQRYKTDHAKQSAYAATQMTASMDSSTVKVAGTDIMRPRLALRHGPNKYDKRYER